MLLKILGCVNWQDSTPSEISVDVTSRPTCCWINDIKIIIKSKQEVILLYITLLNYLDDMDKGDMNMLLTS